MRTCPKPSKSGVNAYGKGLERGQTHTKRNSCATEKSCGPFVHSADQFIWNICAIFKKPRRAAPFDVYWSRQRSEFSSDYSRYLSARNTVKYIVKKFQLLLDRQEAKSNKFNIFSPLNRCPCKLSIQHRSSTRLCVNYCFSFENRRYLRLSFYSPHSHSIVPGGLLVTS